MKKYISLLAAVLLCAFYTKAQQGEAMDELQKIKAYYTGTELKHVSGQMQLKNSITGKQVDRVVFEYWAKDKQVFTKMSYLEILNNNEVYVMVNNKQKTIYAREQAQAAVQQSGAGFFDPEQLNKLLSTKGTSLSIKKGAGNNKLYMSGLQNSRFSSVVITYSATDHKIIAVDAVVSEMPGNSEKLVLEIKYTTTEKTVVSGESVVFSASKYIEKNKKGNYTYTTTYQNYQKL